MDKTIYKSTEEFRKKLRKKSRKELLEILELQDPKIIKGIDRIENVFKTKLNHVKWPDGSPITERPVTHEELVLLVDEPFVPDPNLSKLGLGLSEQKRIHLAKDPVSFAQHFMDIHPRVYQTLMLRDNHPRKILRTGRRAGKTVTLTIEMLHFAFMKKNAKIIVLAPAKVQVQEIYDAVIQYIDESPMLTQDFITRKVRNPQFEIRFANGSAIKFFTTGVSSASKADIVRGQEADLVVLDEMDYMHPDDFIAIMALLQTTDEEAIDQKRLIAASTPSGQRERFYHWIVDPPEGFTSFYFPAYVNPAWTDAIETEQRDYYKSNIMAYRHEIEADFGEDERGVYPRKFLDPCFIQPDSDIVDAAGEYIDMTPSWEYQPYQPDTHDQYVIGVDWNKFSAGTMIVVLQVVAKSSKDVDYRGRVKVCYREEIAQEEYSLMNAVNRIKQLNAIFKPKWIYVDQGFGEVQQELLKQYGVENPDTGLHKKVKAINSAVKVEIRNPLTGEKEKRPYKSMMVNALRDMMEEKQILFPHHDDALYRELSAYVVDRFTQTGEPIFGPGGTQQDHVHDALALACLAITEKMSRFAKKRTFTVPISVNANGVDLEPPAPRAELVSDNVIHGTVPKPSPTPVVGRKKSRSTKSPVLRRPSFGSRGTAVRRKMF
jgi:hypothetical protein